MPILHIKIDIEEEKDNNSCSLVGNNKEAYIAKHI